MREWRMFRAYLINEDIHHLNDDMDIANLKVENAPCAILETKETEGLADAFDRFAEGHEYIDEITPTGKGVFAKSTGELEPGCPFNNFYFFERIIESD